MVFDFNVALGGAWQYPEKRSVGKNIPKKKNGENRGRKMLIGRALRGKGRFYDERRRFSFGFPIVCQKIIAVVYYIHKISSGLGVIPYRR